MLKLYAGRTPMPALQGHIRDMRTMWTLEEVGALYEVEFVNPREDVNKDWYLAMNPFGKVPVLKDGDFTMFESAAICSYVADKHKQLVPALGTQARAIHDQWMYAAIANFEGNCVRLFACDVFFEQNAETDIKRKAALEGLLAWAPGLEMQLQKTRYLMGDEFQLCDLLMSSVLRYPIEKDLLKDFPKLNHYVRGNYDRPAHQRAYAKNGGMLS